MLPIFQSVITEKGPALGKKVTVKQDTKAQHSNIHIQQQKPQK